MILRTIICDICYVRYKFVTQYEYIQNSNDFWTWQIQQFELSALYGHKQQTIKRKLDQS
jgi:hypothetical protein